MSSWSRYIERSWRSSHKSTTIKNEDMMFAFQKVSKGSISALKFLMFCVSN
jgi:hypothetical protein